MCLASSVRPGEMGELDLAGFQRCGARLHHGRFNMNRPSNLIRPTSPRAVADCPALIEEYSAALRVALCFQDFARQLESLQQQYGPPDGCLFLLERDGVFVGCGAIRPFDVDTCEMKRVYIRPVGRGVGGGRATVEALIAESRQLGYQRIVLDTLPSMTEARQPYASLGFVDTTAYRHNPIVGTSSLELAL